ncbi:hypothetical protein TRFO_10913 [Tritrichomonas foetus]|uniref:TPR Domain containing protein n=1 Tax=Tritrichomonas foetus TaxID=1144522 RepID=A0A1J4J925_9EUKA|nr:hypothetical protein TRFO_10913 [Tritrichomonas foetus]|eukprot:OHS94751.1 hypothetical protein TRFO_10913 [Tritrichomonas foetus]
MTSKASPQDKKLIASGFANIKKFIQEENFNQARTEIRKITPIINRVHLFEYELCLMNLLISDKEGKPEEAISNARNAIRIKPDEINPRGVLIKNLKALDKNDEWITEVMLIFTTESLSQKISSKMMIEDISPYLKDFDDDHHELTLAFIEAFKKLENYQTIDIIDQIPETDDTIEFRVDLLKPIAEKDQKACSQLVNILIYEISDQNISEIEKYAKILPNDDENRLLYEIYYGNDPLTNAKIHSQKSDKFRKFVEAAESGDVNKIKQQLEYDTHFSSGWVYLASLLENTTDKLNAFQKALQSNQKSIKLLENIADLQSQLNRIDDTVSTYKKIMELNPTLGSKLLVEYLIKNNRIEQAEAILGSSGSNKSLSLTLKASIAVHHYQKNHDKNSLKFILEIPCDSEIAETKAFVAFELRNEIGDKCQQYFAESLKVAKDNGKIYAYFGKWLDEKGETEKANFLFEKSVSFGEKDDLACDRVTRRLLSEEKLEEALDLCIRLDNDWSHFRAGLILQRLGRHERASSQLQTEVSKRPKNLQAWRALAQSYLVLGRMMSCSSVADYLRSQGKPDEDLEFQIARFNEKPINERANFEIERTPMKFFNYLQQTISFINKMAKFGRLESCNILISTIEPKINDFITKWSNMAASLKLCGDFYLTAFQITKNQQFAAKAIGYFKQRAESDIRPESFIDLANVLMNMGQIEQSVQMLRRVVHKFPDSAPLWTNLGVAFALSDKVSFARHCLCVAAKIATDNESSKIYAYCTYIARLIHDTNLEYRAMDAAKRSNPYDPDVWQLSAQDQSHGSRNKKSNRNNKKTNTLMDQLNASLISYEFGTSPNIIKHIARLYLSLNDPLHALGFALSSDDPSLIAASYEALGKYDLALTFAQDEATKNRLSSLLREKNSNNEILNMCIDNNYQEALNMLKEKTDFISVIASAVCLFSLDKKEEAAKILFDVKEKLINIENSHNETKVTSSENENCYNVDQLIDGLNKLILKIIPKTTESNVEPTDFETEYLLQLRKSNGNQGVAISTAIKKYENYPAAITMYVIAALKDVPNVSQELLIQRAEALVTISPSRQSMILLLLVQIKLQLWIEAFTVMQRLCILIPGFMNKTRSLFNHLKEKYDVAIKNAPKKANSGYYTVDGYIGDDGYNDED